MRCHGEQLDIRNMQNAFAEAMHQNPGSSCFVAIAYYRKGKPKLLRRHGFTELCNALERLDHSAGGTSHIDIPDMIQVCILRILPTWTESACTARSPKRDCVRQSPLLSTLLIFVEKLHHLFCTCRAMYSRYWMLCTRPHTLRTEDCPTLKRSRVLSALRWRRHLLHREGCQALLFSRCLQLRHTFLLH